MDVATLQERLAKSAPTMVVDIRKAEDHEAWSIPGSIGVDAYDDVWAGRFDRLEGLELPAHHTAVFVCHVGKTSDKAAAHLRSLGGNVESLEGGMRAWNHAYNTAQRMLDDGTRLLQVRRTGKGCLSYMAIHGDEALVIDANLDPLVYTQLAERHGATILGALDTHVHADHLSRSHLLARHLGVPYHISHEARMSFPVQTLQEGDQLACGGSALEVLATPGHTWDSSTYRVGGQDILTGDTLFVDGVGRPDLGAGKQEVKDRAHALYESLQRLAALPAATVVLPAHASRPLPFDEVSWSATVADVRQKVPLLAVDECTFVERLLASTPDVPAAYGRMVELNRSGLLPEDEADELEAGANRCAAG